MRSLISLSFFALLNYGLIAQQHTLVGKVVSEGDGLPLSYCTIKILNPQNEVLNGALTIEDGTFSLDATGKNFVLEVESIGFESYKSSAIQISKESKLYDFGTIQLKMSSLALNEVEVRAEKSKMEFALDKKIFNVGQDLANTGGTASDVLMNVPSVTVDPDGGIKLRGSNNVRILIDGKPSGLVSFKGGAGLRQLQANMIDKVEVITNPSARYEAEGMAGIINIVLKKDRKEGFNGSLELITGMPANYGFASNINYRKKKLNFFLNYSFAYQIAPNRANLSQSRSDALGNHFLLEQTTNGEKLGLNNNIRGGLDYFFSETSILTASYMFSRSDGRRLTTNTYKDLDITSGRTFLSSAVREQDEDEIEPISEYVVDYKKTFAREGHSLNAQFRFLDHWEESYQLFTERFFDESQNEISLPWIQESINDEFEKQYLFQLDYVQPIGKKGKFETGVRTSLRDMVNDFVINEKNEAGQFIVLPEFDNYFVYDENINAVYGILGNEKKQFSYQIGVRGEWTDIATELRETNEVNPRNYFNLFPSGHFSLRMEKENNLQLSYSRRIRRPVYNDLTPFMTFSDSRNFFSGNPDLDPEFSDVFELGHLKYFENATVSTAVYYRSTDGTIDRIRRVDNTGFATTRPENLNGSYAWGLDFTADYRPFDWWKMDLNLNLFNETIDGANIDETYQVNTTTWFSRYSSRFQFKNHLDIQLRVNYDAPRLVAQGNLRSITYVDFAVSKELWKDKGRITLNVMDLFNSRISRYLAMGPGFEAEGETQRRVRQVNLTMAYKFKQKAK